VDEHKITLKPIFDINRNLPADEGHDAPADERGGYITSMGIEKIYGSDNLWL
jgi:hypothetical protein